MRVTTLIDGVNNLVEYENIPQQNARIKFKVFVDGVEIGTVSGLCDWWDCSSDEWNDGFKNAQSATKFLVENYLRRLRFKSLLRIEDIDLRCTSKTLQDIVVLYKNTPIGTIKAVDQHWTAYGEGFSRAGFTSSAVAMRYLINETSSVPLHFD